VGSNQDKEAKKERPPLATVEVVIPVYNEENDLPESIAKLYKFMEGNLTSYNWHILIADNGSTDSSLEVARRLSQVHSRVKVLHLDQKGRGRALHKAWSESKADVRCYMDVDLSTDLVALPKLVDAIAKRGADIAIGSRLTTEAKVVNRTLKRELLSRGYITIIRAMFFVGFSDAQCGFKAISKDAAKKLLPLIKDRGWFFDSELLIIAEKNGFRIQEVPVQWTDDMDSRVNVIKTASGDLKGLLRLRFGGLKEASRRLSQKQMP